MPIFYRGISTLLPPFHLDKNISEGPNLMMDITLDKILTFLTHAHHIKNYFAVLCQLESTLIKIQNHLYLPVSEGNSYFPLKKTQPQ